MSGRSGETRKVCTPGLVTLWLSTPWAVGAPLVA